MAGLVGTDNEHQISHCRSRSHVPVLNSNLRSKFVHPLLQTPSFSHCCNNVRVCVHRFLLDITNETVADGGIEAVDSHKGCHEDTLRSNHCCTEPRPRLFDGDKSEQVHALVLSFLQERVDPTVIASHVAQRRQVPQHATRHAWYASHSLEEDDAVHDHLLGHGGGGVAGQRVKEAPHEPHSTQRHFVPHALGRPMHIFHTMHLLLRPHRVLKRIVPRLWVVSLRFEETPRFGVVGRLEMQHVVHDI
mmetsp:Transcript_46065/g.74223  ORF Transcript_46065/g.74223 Transcript_46065/m.74223 type:complete len:247 (+) Transcript_46065:268-1008(+)